VQPTVADESDGNDDVNQMDDMVADIGKGYVLEYEDPSWEVQNFYAKASLQTNHAMAETVVPVRRNNAINAVTQERDT
jgi:hypothetical protein